MQRRALLAGLLGGSAWLLASGHTPYEQWVVYRKRTLLIGSVRSDPPTYELAERIATHLAERLPKSRARLSRAANYRRLASLLGTAQLEVAVLSRARAIAMAGAGPPFTDFEPLPLRRLYDMGDYILTSHADFPARHAYLVSRTLAEKAAPVAGTVLGAVETDGIPPHPGSTAYARGAPLPAPPAETLPATHSHDETD